QVGQLARIFPRLGTIPQALTRTRTSLSPGLGVGSFSSLNAPPTSCIRAAVIVSDVTISLPPLCDVDGRARGRCFFEVTLAQIFEKATSFRNFLIRADRSRGERCVWRAISLTGRVKPGWRREGESEATIVGGLFGCGVIRPAGAPLV